MAKLHLIMCAAGALLAMAACAPAGGGMTPEPRGDQTGGPLVLSLQVQPRGGVVHFTLSATNQSTAPVALTFPSGQSFDFAVLRGSNELWRWSGDRSFTQAIREESLAPGETRTYEADWTPAAGVHGELVARGKLTALQNRAEQSTYFTLP